MSSTLALTALLMGLAGGPHCVAMCGVACAGLARAARGGVRTVQEPIHFQAGASGASPVEVSSATSASDLPFVLFFQLGRVLGYAALGGLAAASMQGLGWLTVHSAALRPLWSLLHIAAIALGLVLLWRAAQPVWLEQGAQALWRRVQRFMHRRSSSDDGLGGRGARASLLLIGSLWALLPCGLLYSALLIATLTGQAWQGAAVMALFALGTAVSMTLGPWLWLRLGQGAAQRNPVWQNLGVRLAGLALVLSSAWALWMGLAHDTAPWCVTPV
jgi:sulfite exporter TauE/SafE